MKKLTVPCNVAGKETPIDLYIGRPKKGVSPVHNQSSWLSKERGVALPTKIIKSLNRLLEISEKNKVNFAELCQYAVEAAKSPASQEVDEMGNKKTDNID